MTDRKAASSVFVKRVVLCCVAAALLRPLAVSPRAEEKKPPAKTRQDATSLPGMPGMEETAPGVPPGHQGFPSQAGGESNQEPGPGTAQPGRGHAAPQGPSPSSQGFPSSPQGSQFPSEVVIRGADAGQKLGVKKPPLSVETDPFDSIRNSLQPDLSLLLSESPDMVIWRRTYPEQLMSPRVADPSRTTFSERPGIAFNVLEHLQEVLGRPVSSKEARGFQWSLTIADEEGRVFQRYEGSNNVPEELVWTGQNDQGDWIRAGRSYSAVYMFVDSGGSPRTKVGKPVQFTGVTHQEPDGLHISLDSGVLFGPVKAGREIEKSGRGLLRSAADLVKRRFGGIPLRIQVFASTKELAEAQAAVTADYLRGELMVPPQGVTTESSHAPFSEQRVEVLLLNR